MANDCGCPPNDSSLLTGPAGDQGTSGLDTTCENGTDAKSRIDTSFGLGVCQTTNSWTTVGYIVYPGTLNLPQAITKILAIARTTASGQLRIVSGLGTIATSAIFTNGNAAIIDLGTIDASKLSNSVQLLQLQAIANAGQVEIFALSLLSI
jgi:hypothetical protein